MKYNKYIRYGLLYILCSFIVLYMWFTNINQNTNTTLKKIFDRWERPVSLCNDQSSKEGFHQKVVSYSLYAKNGVINDYFLKRYMNGVTKNHQQIRQFYPGWLMRIYTNDVSMFKMEKLKSYIDENQKDLFVCDVTAVNSFLGNLSSLDGSMWRFLPMFDPTVDIFISRDLDSNIGERELSAVKQWEASSSIFHAMRDHPYHHTSILAGMWGGKNYLMDDKITSSLKNSLLKMNRTNHRKGIDQVFLDSNLYGPFKNHIMQHDSYTCKLFKGSIPFPEQRRNPKLFVGGFNHLGEGNKIFKECPIDCRPIYGKDWKYC